MLDLDSDTPAAFTETDADAADGHSLRMCFATQLDLLRAQTIVPQKRRQMMAQITLLDGGMGQELVARSGDEPTPLWATRVMLDHPGMVREIHADYFAAGATIATTNTYAIHHDRLERFDLDDQFEALHCAALAAGGRGAGRPWSRPYCRVNGAVGGDLSPRSDAAAG